MSDGSCDDSGSLCSQPDEKSNQNPLSIRADMNTPDPSARAAGKAPSTEEDGLDDSSVFSSSSTSSSSVQASPTLAERRARNMQRNAELLERLGLLHGIVPKQQSAPLKTRKRAAETEDDPADSRPRGMTLATRAKPQQQSVDHVTLETIYSKYPHREAQLRRLLGCLLPSSSHIQGYIPPPIICHGPAGTGKTSIVQDVLSLLPDRRTAYLNCQTFEQVGSAEQIMRQLLEHLRSIKHPTSRHSKQTKLRKRVQRRQQHATDEYEKKTRSRLAVETNIKESTKRYTTYSLQADMSSMADSTETPLCAVWNFGLELRERSTKYGCSVLVIDHADLLLSKVYNNKNLLSQLLLLPQVFDLNLAIVLITNNYLLPETRMDILAQSAGATISSDVHPIALYFSPYRAKEIKSILLQPVVRRAVVGSSGEAECNDGRRGFADKVYQSFLDTVIQTIQGRTTDIKEMIQLVRPLWQTYVGPLTTVHAKKIFEDAKQAAMSKLKGAHDRGVVERELLSLLDNKARVFLRDSGSIYGIIKAKADSLHDLPMLTKYLLLAAYLCRINHAEKDKQLFSMRKSGRRKHRTSRDEQEDSAFGSNAEKNPSTSIRPRTFPLERVLSVYVSIVGLQRSQADDDRITYLGDLQFNSMLCSLCEASLLHEHPVQSAVEAPRMTDPRYYTSITDEDARSLARALNFPLDKYTL